jgi:hypothetical protein
MGRIMECYKVTMRKALHSTYDSVATIIVLEFKGITNSNLFNFSNIFFRDNRTAYWHYSFWHLTAPLSGNLSIQRLRDVGNGSSSR